MPMYSIGRDKTLRKAALSQEARAAAVESAVRDLASVESEDDVSGSPSNRGGSQDQL